MLTEEATAEVPQLQLPAGPVGRGESPQPGLAYRLPCRRLEAVAVGARRPHVGSGLSGLSTQLTRRTEQRLPGTCALALDGAWRDIAPFPARLRRPALDLHNVWPGGAHRQLPAGRPRRTEPAGRDAAGLRACSAGWWCCCAAATTARCARGTRPRTHPGQRRVLKRRCARRDVSAPASASPRPRRPRQPRSPRRSPPAASARSRARCR